jgi:hypothetical protein
VGKLILKVGSCGAVFVVLAVTTMQAAAVGLGAADLAWIDKCIADREIEKLDPVKLRKYCTCMQQIVDDNEPFSVSELEHSYPPAHVMCQDEAGF